MSAKAMVAKAIERACGRAAAKRQTRPYSAIIREIAAKGKDARFRKTGPGPVRRQRLNYPPRPNEPGHAPGFSSARDHARVGRDSRPFAPRRALFRQAYQVRQPRRNPPERVPVPAQPVVLSTLRVRSYPPPRA